MADALDRDDIITGLRELVGELHAAGEVAGIRLVGGAALAIRYFDRRTTGDLGSLHVQPGSDDAVLAAASRFIKISAFFVNGLQLQLLSPNFRFSPRSIGLGKNYPKGLLRGGR